MSITIKEIAKLANVSPTSVSLVLNNKPCRISQETKDNIKRIAKLEGYQANSIARSLVTKKTNALGLLIPNIENTYFSNITQNISHLTQREGYCLLLTHSNDSHKQDLHLIQELIHRGVDGLFLVLSDESFKGNRFQKIKYLLNEAKIPFVLIDRVPSDYSCNKVFVDNTYGGYLAGEYLIAKGHTKIGYIHNPHSLNGQKRILGFQAALKKHGLTVHSQHITEGDFSIESGYQAGSSYILNDVSALFVSNDLMSYGLIKYFRERHIRPMIDIEIVGYDNLVFTKLLEFPFPSIDQNISDIGLHAFNLLLGQLSDNTPQPQEICLTPFLNLNQPF